MRIIAMAAVVCCLAASVSGQTLKRYTSDEYGFSIEYPSDWTVRPSSLQSFKAVKKFPDGQFLMLVVNIQTANNSLKSTDQVTVNQLLALVKQAYGTEDIAVLESSRGTVSGQPCLRVILNANTEYYRRIENYTWTIQRPYLYTVAVSCNEPLYSQYKAQLDLIANTFQLTNDQPPAKTSARSPSPDVLDYLVFKESDESTGSAFPKAFGEVFVKTFLALVAFSIIGVLWKRLKPQKSKAAAGRAMAPKQDAEDQGDAATALDQLADSRKDSE